MVHVRIHKRFGFKEWRIEPRNKNKDLICIMTLPGSILFPKYIPKLFLWEIMHLIHDSFIPFLCMALIRIIVNLKEFIFVSRKIIKEVLKEVD